MPEKPKLSLASTNEHLPRQTRPGVTPGQALRAFCLACLGCKDAAGAFDCRSPHCGLYRAHPFRGKPMPNSKQPLVEGKLPERILAREAGQQEAAPTSKRKPCASLLRAYCRDHCQPEDRTDCKGEECALYPWQPFGIGRRAKRVLSEKQLTTLRANLARADTPKVWLKKPKQRGSSRAGSFPIAAGV